MTDTLLAVLRLGAALGCGLMAGVFFAFSVFVMKALTHLPPAQGIAAMQSINVAVLNPWFLAAFVGTGAACLLTGATSLWRWQEAGAGYLLLGAALYLVGTFLVTAVFNVPLNDALAAAPAAAPESAGQWAAYLGSWTAWNHVRTAAAFGAAALLTIGLCRPFLPRAGQ
jgi:uncharacterized membrane protein